MALGQSTGVRTHTASSFHGHTQGRRRFHAALGTSTELPSPSYQWPGLAHSFFLPNNKYGTVPQFLSAKSSLLALSQAMTCVSTGNSLLGLANAGSFSVNPEPTNAPSKPPFQQTSVCGYPPTEQGSTQRLSPPLPCIVEKIPPSPILASKTFTLTTQEPFLLLVACRLGPAAPAKPGQAGFRCGGWAMEKDLTRLYRSSLCNKHLV